MCRSSPLSPLSSSASASPSPKSAVFKGGDIRVNTAASNSIARVIERFLQCIRRFILGFLKEKPAGEDDKIRLFEHILQDYKKELLSSRSKSFNSFLATLMGIISSSREKDKEYPEFYKYFEARFLFPLIIESEPQERCAVTLTILKAEKL